MPTHVRRSMIVAVALLTLMAAMAPAMADDDGIDLDFLSGDWDNLVVYVTDVAGTHLEPVSRGQVGDYAYSAKAWSPDGTRIAYVSSASGSQRLYVVDADGTDDIEVAGGPFDLALGLHWSPDGTRIAFVSDRDGKNSVFVADVASGTVTKAANGMGGTAIPTWSPDGTRIGFPTIAGGGSDFAWSPDGSRFLFVTERDGNSEIYVADADGSNQVNLTQHSADDTSAIWSPDGSTIAFSSGVKKRSDGGVYEILVPSRVYVMDADGGNRRALTDGSIDPVPPPPEYPSLQYSLAHSPQRWSPDGRRLTVTVDTQYPSAHGQFFYLYVVDVAGDQPPVPIAEGGGGVSVRWSPDGTRLIFSESGNYGGIGGYVFVVAAGGGPVTKLLTGTGVGATWSPDGQRILLHPSAMAVRSDVIVTGPDGSNPANLTAGLEGPHNWGPSWQPQRLGPVGLVDPGTGRWYVRDEWGWQRSFYFGNPGDVPFLGDWDCDGEETPGLYREADGYVYLRNSNTQGVADIAFYFGNAGDVPLAGDFNGDGCDTVSLYRPSEGRVYIINRLGSQDVGLGAAETAYYFGNPGDKPFVGDFDGDGIDTIGLHRETTGFMYLRQTHTAGTADVAFYYGDPGDLVVAADWAGDGTDTVGVFRPSEHRFYLRYTNAAGTADRSFWLGRATWVPIAGAVTPSR